MCGIIWRYIAQISLQRSTCHLDLGSEVSWQPPAVSSFRILLTQGQPFSRQPTLMTEWSGSIRPNHFGLCRTTLTGSICFRAPHHVGWDIFTLHYNLTTSSVQSTYFLFFQRYWSLINIQTLSQLLLLKNPKWNTYLWRNSLLWLQLWPPPNMLMCPQYVSMDGSFILESQLHLITSLLEILSVFQTELNLTFYSVIQQIFLECLLCSKHCITGDIPMRQTHISIPSPYGGHSTGEER